MREEPRTNILESMSHMSAHTSQHIQSKGFVMYERLRFDVIVSILALAVGGLGASACSTSEPKPRADERPSTERTIREGATLDDVASMLPNGAHPFEDIVTAGQPAPEQLEQVSDVVRTVVNLRPHDEEGARDESREAQKLGLGYAHIPIAGTDDLNRKNVERFDEILQNGEKPLLTHCSSSNRVGALFALRAFWLDEASLDEALEIGRKAGLTKLETPVRNIMKEDRM